MSRIYDVTVTQRRRLRVVTDRAIKNLDTMKKLLTSESYEDIIDEEQLEILTVEDVDELPSTKET